MAGVLKVQDLLPDEQLYELRLRNIDPADPACVTLLQIAIDTEIAENCPDISDKARITRKTVKLESNECSIQLHHISKALESAAQAGNEEEAGRVHSRVLHITGRIRRLEAFAPEHTGVQRLVQRARELQMQVVTARESLGGEATGSVGEQTKGDGEVEAIAGSSPSTGAVPKLKQGSDRHSGATFVGPPAKDQSGHSSAPAPQFEANLVELSMRAQADPQQERAVACAAQSQQAHQVMSLDNFFPTTLQLSQQRGFSHSDAAYRRSPAIANVNNYPTTRDTQYCPPPEAQQVRGQLGDFNDFAEPAGQGQRRQYPVGARGLNAYLDAAADHHHQQNRPQRMMDGPQMNMNAYPDAAAGHYQQQNRSQRMMDRPQADMGPSNGHHMHKWNLWFDGSAKGLEAEEFVFRAERQALLHGVSQRALSIGLGNLLRDKAAQWFWTYQRQHQNATWEELKRAFISRYALHRDTDFEIRARIEARKQQSTERFNDFCQDVEALAVRLVRRLTDEDLVDVLRRNMQLPLRKALFQTPTRTVDDLLRHCNEYERICRDERTPESQKVMRVSEIIEDRSEEQYEKQHQPQFDYRWQQQQYDQSHQPAYAPPMPYFAPIYQPNDPRLQQHHVQMNEQYWAEPCEPQFERGMAQVAAIEDETAGYVEAMRSGGGIGKRIVCWNCQEVGHLHSQCTKPQMALFCFTCGLKGHTTMSCPTCSLNSKGGKPAAVATRPAIPTLPQNFNRQTQPTLPTPGNSAKLPNAFRRN